MSMAEGLFAAIHELNLAAGFETSCLLLVDQAGSLRELSFIRSTSELHRARRLLDEGAVSPTEAAQERLARCMAELDAYGVAQLRAGFSLSECELSGATVFQQKCYQAVYRLGWGESASYKEIAQEIGHPHAYRAVANALRANQLLLVIPCHRVVASSGIGGYWPGLDCKRALMVHEGMRIDGF